MIKKIIAIPLMSVLIFSTVMVIPSVYSESSLEKEVSAASVPSNPKTAIDRKPSVGTEWVGATNINSPTFSNDTKGDFTDVASVASVIAGIANIPTGAAIAVATIIYNRNASTLYYDTYQYTSNKAGSSVEIAKVTYFYTNSSKSADSYAGRTVGYTSMHDFAPVTDK